MLKLLLLIALLVLAAPAAPRLEEITLWPKGAPGSEGVDAAEMVQGPDDFRAFERVSSIHKPSILISLPPKDKATGVAMVVAPGGGHQFLVIGKEGYDIAQWLNERGIAAFILKYRLARDINYKEGTPKYTVQDHALADAARAIRTVRSRSKEWGVNPRKIGFMGFSAGGEVAALIGARFDTGQASSSDPLEKVSSRPDFNVVVYPGFRPGIIKAPPDAPPTFILCADDDRSHIRATLEVYTALHEQKVPAELHIYATGGHGFGMKDVNHPVTTWPKRLEEWMTDQEIWSGR